MSENNAENAAAAHQIIPIDVFSQNFKELQYEMSTQGLASQVKQFSGEGNSRNFRTWIRDMQKVGVSVD